MPLARREHLVTDALSNTYSQRQLASKYGISLPYTNKILQDYEVTAYKKEKRPFLTENQTQTQCERLPLLIEKLSDLDVVMDDESYFTLQHCSIPGNSYYYATERGDADLKVRTSPRKKFEHKLMMWIAISPKGISKPYFCKSGEAVTSNVYVEHCIKRKLVPFLNEHHADGKYIFWPDLASSHYANATLSALNDLGVTFVDKPSNPPCSPQLRPIEDFWGILKQEVYKGSWVARDHEALKKRIRYCLTKVDVQTVCSMMLNVKQSIEYARIEEAASSHR